MQLTCKLLVCKLENNELINHLNYHVYLYSVKLVK